MSTNNRKVAECVGLWLAEGDNKSKSEITFTNSEFSLIKLFHKTMEKIFLKNRKDFNIRIYVYTSDGAPIRVPLKVDWINRYVDKRARRPYYIWRLASTKMYNKWKRLVEYHKENPTSYSDILRGFFAGEGNIKEGKNSQRTIRIAQKKSEFVEKLLQHFRVDYRYRVNDRSYYITHKFNWDKLSNIKIADLHPDKKKRFWKLYKEFKEEHYKNNHIRGSVLRVRILILITRLKILYELFIVGVNDD